MRVQAKENEDIFGNFVYELLFLTSYCVGFGSDNSFSADEQAINTNPVYITCFISSFIYIQFIKVNCGCFRQKRLGEEKLLGRKKR